MLCTTLLMYIACLCPTLYYTSNFQTQLVQSCQLSRIARETHAFVVLVQIRIQAQISCWTPQRHTSLPSPTEAGTGFHLTRDFILHSSISVTWKDGMAFRTPPLSLFTFQLCTLQGKPVAAHRYSKQISTRSQLIMNYDIAGSMSHS